MWNHVSLNAGEGFKSVGAQISRCCAAKSDARRGQQPVDRGEIEVRECNRRPRCAEVIQRKVKHCVDFA